MSGRGHTQRGHSNIAEYTFMRLETRLVGHRWATWDCITKTGALAWDGYLDTCHCLSSSKRAKKTPINAHVQRARAADVIHRYLINRIWMIISSTPRTRTKWSTTKMSDEKKAFARRVCDIWCRRNQMPRPMTKTASIRSAKTATPMATATLNATSVSSIYSQYFRHLPQFHFISLVAAQSSR